MEWMKDEHETRAATVRLRTDGILEFRYKDAVDVTLLDAQKLAQSAAELTDKPLRTLVIISRVRSVSKDARSFFIGKENQALSSNVALVAGTAISSMIGNFFLGLNKPPFPTRVFADEGTALAWLMRESDESRQSDF